MKLSELLENKNDFKEFEKEFENYDLHYNSKQIGRALEISLIDYDGSIEDLIEDFESSGLGNKFAFEKISDDVFNVVLNPVNESIDFKNGEDAETTCEFLRACGVPFKKSFRDDGTGADFSMTNFSIARKVIKALKKHKKICRNFDVQLEKGSNTIKVYFK